MHAIRRQAYMEGCFGQATTERTSACQELIFRLGSSLVFANVDPSAGLGHLLILATDSRHVNAMVAAGVTLIEGIGVIANVSEGIRWLEKAAALGSSQALYELGAVYYTGVKGGFVDADPAKAYDYFDQAARQGHAAAMFMAAICQWQGHGVKKNEEVAVALFSEAADAGHYFAREQLREPKKTAVV